MLVRVSLVIYYKQGLYQEELDSRPLFCPLELNLLILLKSVDGYEPLFVQLSV